MPMAPMTTKAAAQALTVSEQTVRRYVHNGVLPAKRLMPSRRLLLSPEDVYRLLSEAR